KSCPCLWVLPSLAAGGVRPTRSGRRRRLPSRPPRLTLFPYTTLFRSDLENSKKYDVTMDKKSRYFRNFKNPPTNLKYVFSDLLRSEEHTSELQSRFDLVCRLLLEIQKDLLDIPRRLCEPDDPLTRIDH